MESVAALRGNLAAADAEQKSGQSKRALKEASTAQKEASTAQRRLSDRSSSDGEETEQDHCNDMMKNNSR